MEDIDINIPEEELVNDFTIIYKGGKEKACDNIEQIEEIKTSKEEILRKLRYFKTKNNEIKYLNEIYIHDKYPIQIFREFINSIKTRHIKVNENNYLILLEMSSKYEYHELQEQIKIYSETRPDLNNLINKYEQEGIDSTKEENISQHLDICLRNKNMNKFPIPVLNRILNSPTRVINDHHLLYNFIKQIIQNKKHQTKNDQNEHNSNSNNYDEDEDRENYEILLGSLDYSRMSNEELEEFLNETSFSFVFNSRGMRDKMKEMKEERKHFETIISTIEKKINIIETKMNETQNIHTKSIEEINETMNKKLEQQERIILSIQKENEHLREIIQKHESKFEQFDQQNQIIFNIQKEKEELQEKIQKHEIRIQQLEQQNEMISNIQKENENIKETIQKQKLGIQKLEQKEQTIFNIQKENENLHEIIQKQELRIQKLENQSMKTFSPRNDESICGIINFLHQKSNKNIENEINITTSSYCDADFEPRYSLSFNNLNKFYCSKDTPNSWICYEFKNHRIIPTHYTIRTLHGGPDSSHLRNWAIECSKDNNSWETIDEEVNNSSLNGKNYVHTFKINKQISTEFRYIRIRSTGKDWSNNNWLAFNLFEIYGKLI